MSVTTNDKSLTIKQIQENQFSRKTNRLEIKVTRRTLDIQSNVKHGWIDFYEIDFHDLEARFDFEDTEFSLDLSLNNLERLINVLLQDEPFRQRMLKYFKDNGDL